MASARTAAGRVGATRTAAVLITSAGARPGRRRSRSDAAGAHGQVLGVGVGRRRTDRGQRGLGQQDGLHDGHRVVHDDAAGHEDQEATGQGVQRSSAEDGHPPAHDHGEAAHDPLPCRQQERTDRQAGEQDDDGERREGDGDGRWHPQGQPALGAVGRPVDQVGAHSRPGADDHHEGGHGDPDEVDGLDTAPHGGGHGDGDERREGDPENRQGDDAGHQQSQQDGGPSQPQLGGGHPGDRGRRAAQRVLDRRADGEGKGQPEHP